MEKKMTDKTAIEYMGTIGMFDNAEKTLRVGVMAFRYIYNKGLWEDFGKYADEKFKEIEDNERNDITGDSGA